VNTGVITRHVKVGVYVAKPRYSTLTGEGEIEGIRPAARDVFHTQGKTGRTLRLRGFPPQTPPDSTREAVGNCVTHTPRSFLQFEHPWPDAERESEHPSPDAERESELPDDRVNSTPQKGQQRS
jgi:hypothetical protein